MNYYLVSNFGSLLIAIFFCIISHILLDDSNILFVGLSMISLIVGMWYSNYTNKIRKNWIEITLLLVSSFSYLAISFIFIVEYLLEYDPFKFHPNLDIVIIILFIIILSEPICVWWYKKKYDDYLVMNI